MASQDEGSADDASQIKSNKQHLLDHELDSANAGSFTAAMADIVDGTVTFLVPGIAQVDRFSHPVENVNREKLMQDTGQTSVSDRLKWTLFPNSMEEKTFKGVQGAMDKVVLENVKQQDQRVNDFKDYNSR